MDVSRSNWTKFNTLLFLLFVWLRFYAVTKHLQTRDSVYLYVGFAFYLCATDVTKSVTVIYTHANVGWSYLHTILHFTVIYFVLYNHFKFPNLNRMLANI